MENHFDLLSLNQNNFGKNSHRLKIYLSEPPSFGTLTNPFESNCYFFPFKSFNKNKFNENFLSFEKSNAQIDTFYLIINYVENSEIKSKHNNIIDISNKIKNKNSLFVFSFIFLKF